jgi:hypothetical protein
MVQLRNDPPDDLRHVERLYRDLVKRTHPDRSHDDGELFRYVREQFARYREDWKAERRRELVTRGFDSHAVLRDLGLSEMLGPRPALLAALYRFRALGLASWKVRSRPSLRRRNTLVIKAVVAWGYRYDTEFVRVFQEFLLRRGEFSPTDSTGPLYFLVRRMILKGLDGLIRYQDGQYRATADIARDTIHYALRISCRYRRNPSFAAVHEFAEWVLRELELPPDPIGLDG